MSILNLWTIFGNEKKRGGCTYNPDGKSIIHDETIIVIPGESTKPNAYFFILQTKPQSYGPQDQGNKKRVLPRNALGQVRGTNHYCVDIPRLH